jgi:hypothetical protein
MARWLPQMMASATGMRSMAGFERLLASAQASVTTAGGKDQAGNNLVNLLAKMNSQDAATEFKKRGIDLSGTLARAREKGQLPLDAFVDLLDREVVGKDKRFQALKARAAKSEGTDKAGALGDMADILQASAVGSVVADRQALVALVAEMTQRDYIKQVMQQMQGADGAVDAAFETCPAPRASNSSRRPIRRISPPRACLTPWAVPWAESWTGRPPWPSGSRGWPLPPWARPRPSG